MIKKLNPSHIIVGKNFRFGNQRKGNIALLRKFGKKHNFKVSDLRLANEKKTKISSTRIRLAIEKGNVDLAGRLLGRNWSIREKVIPGRKIGRQLGFRTANIIIKNNIAPKIGVYAVKAKIKNKIYNGVANFGLAPTFSRNKLVLEINLFKKIPPFYGQFAEIAMPYIMVWLSPSIITGNARGIFTDHSICRFVHPIISAASITPSGRLRNPCSP